MSNTLPPSVAAKIASEEKAIDSNAMEDIRSTMVELRALDLQIETLQENLKAAQAKQNAIVHQRLPELFIAAQIKSFELAPDGNEPGISAQLKPFYSANIAANWPAERRAEAFAYIEDLGSGDMIKSQIVVNIPRGHVEEARNLASLISQRGFLPEVKEAIPHATLTSWLKEQVEKYSTIPDLAKIGGNVGQVVKIKRIDEG